VTPHDKKKGTAHTKEPAQRDGKGIWRPRTHNTPGFGGYGKRRSHKNRAAQQKRGGRCEGVKGKKKSLNGRPTRGKEKKKGKDERVDGGDRSGSPDQSEPKGGQQKKEGTMPLNKMRNDGQMKGWGTEKP